MLESTIDRLTRAALRFKRLTIGLSVGALVAGGVALTQMRQELIPNIEFPQTVVLAFNPGAESQDMLDQVTIPLEDAVRSIDGVVNVESSTSLGVASFIIQNEFGLDPQELRADISAAVQGLDYPEGMDTPELLTFGLEDFPVAFVSVSSPELTLARLKTLVESEVIPALESVPAVASVQVRGGQELPTDTDPPPSPRPAQPPTPTPTTETSSIPLPDRWIEAAQLAGLTVATTADLTPELVASALQAAPELLEALTPEMVLAAPLESVGVVPLELIENLDPELQAAFAERLTELPPSEMSVELVALPDSWINAAEAQGVTISTTDDLIPALVDAIVSIEPELLADLTPEMLLAMPIDAVASLPQEYLLALDPDLQGRLMERLASAPGQGDSRELPIAWQAAGQALDITLSVPEDVTPEIIQGIASFAPQLLDMLSPEHLRRFSPEALAWLPADYLDELDPNLRAELDERAAQHGGAGALAAEATGESEAFAAGAPDLAGSWLRPPDNDPTAESRFQTAADLINSGFAPTAADFLNLLVTSGQPTAPELIADLTPEVIAWLDENEPGFLDSLEPATMRLLSPQVLEGLPEDFLASLGSELRAELEGIAAGTVEVFIPTDTINRVNGNPSLGLAIFREGEANIVAVSHAVFAELEELERVHSSLRFGVVFEQASFIEESISGVTREGSLGAVFAVLVILIFLSGHIQGRYRLSWRSTLVTAVSIPLSVMMAFALFRWLPPITELVLSPLAGATAGIPAVGAAVTALRRLFPLDLTLNIMTLSGMTVAIGRVVDDSIVVLENIYRHIQRGEDRRQSVLVGTRDVAIAIFASTVTTVVVFLPIGLLGGLIGAFFLPFGVAVTYALASSFIVAVTIVPLLAFLFMRKEHLPEPRETTLQRWYTPILKWSLKSRALTLAIAGVLFAGSLFLLNQQPRAFLPDLGEVQITASVDLPGDVSMAETDQKVAQFEAALAAIEGLGTIRSETGSMGGLAGQFLGESLDQGAASIQIGVENTAEVDDLTSAVRQSAAAVFGSENVVVSSGTFGAAGLGGFGLVLSGDPDEIAAIDDEVVAVLNGIDGLANASSNLADSDAILRVDGEPSVRYAGEVETTDSLGVISTAIAEIEALVPDSIAVSPGFQSRQQTEGFAQAARAIVISIAAVYLVMVLTFRSFVHPFTILFSLPLAIIGAAVALWLTNRVLGIAAMVGLMMLVGIVVTNAIILVARVLANREKRKMQTYDALLEGGRTRLRPILMTASAAILALVPLGLGLTEGAIIAAELATVVIGGLATSTMLTLLVVPVMFSLVDQLTSRGMAAAPAPDSD